MLRFLAVSLSVILCSCHASANDYWLEKLDSAISERPRITAEKEHRISDLRQTIINLNNTEEKLRFTDLIYEEYLTYRYDSAMVYAEREKDLAISLGDSYYQKLAIIHRALLYARGGYYAEAEADLNGLHVEDLDRKLLYEYYMARFWLYMYWGEYSSSSTLKPIYHKKMEESLLEALSLEEKDSPNYLYLKGQQHAIVENNQEAAFRVRTKLIGMLPINSKLYASTAYDIAWYYQFNSNTEKYVEWISKAAISDILTPLKENLAMQELAMFLFENGGDLDRATRYIYISMEDAQFFDNRLRIFEISKKFPSIMTAYTDKIQSQKSRILYGLILLALLTIIVLSSQLYIRKQYTQLHLHRQELQAMNEMLKTTNDKLTETNDKLLDTNQKREGLAKIYIDLCATYIDKLKKYQTLVKRKIKANQVNELLSTMSSSRISEEDAAIFLGKFDKAFLNLYPTFVQELNTLLTTEQQIAVKQGDALTTELRIYALIRLGVKESAEIADLLFYSPQTIYNYRSSLKNRAINKETFDEDVQKICSVIRKSW